MLGSINLLAVIVAVLAGTAVGAFWYSPFILGKQWIAEMGKQPEEMGDPKKAMIMSTFNTLLVAICLSLMLGWSGHQSLLSGAAFGAFIWLGFVATSQVLGVFFQGDSWKFFWINTGNQLLTYIVMGAILSVWR